MTAQPGTSGFTWSNSPHCREEGPERICLESHSEFVVELGLEIRFPGTSKVYIDFHQFGLTNDTSFVNYPLVFDSVLFISTGRDKFGQSDSRAYMDVHNKDPTITSNLYFVPKFIKTRGRSGRSRSVNIGWSTQILFWRNKEGLFREDARTSMKGGTTFFKIKSVFGSGRTSLSIIRNWRAYSPKEQVKLGKVCRRKVLFGDF